MIYLKKTSIWMRLFYFCGYFTDASNSIVFGVKYSKILLEDRDDHLCMKQKPVIGDNSLFCEKENGNDYDENTVVIYHKLIRRISLAMSR